MAEITPQRERADAASAYKAVLKRVLDARPSGTRHRLAIALGKNRSFISFPTCMPLWNGLMQMGIAGPLLSQTRAHIISRIEPTLGS